jgi:predicted nucleic-acid-binding protein
LRVTVDTNVLVRGAALDDAGQAAQAATLLREAEAIVVPQPVLCEFAWVMRHSYRWNPAQVAGFIRSLVGSPTVLVDRSVAEAGLAMLDAGGDFADGVIAFAGRQMGGAVFASFDRRAVDLVRAAGSQAQLLAAASDAG